MCPPTSDNLLTRRAVPSPRLPLIAGHKDTLVSAVIFVVQETQETVVRKENYEFSRESTSSTTESVATST